MASFRFFCETGFAAALLLLSKGMGRRTGNKQMAAYTRPPASATAPPGTSPT